MYIGSIKDVSWIDPICIKYVSINDQYGLGGVFPSLRFKSAII